MDYVFLLGRILYGGFFIFSAYNYFFKSSQLVQYAAGSGVPMPKTAVFVSGLFILGGGAGVILGVYVQAALWLLVLFLAVVSFTMHRFWKDTDPNMKMMNMVNFNKNMALLGAALMLMLLSEPWALGI